MALVAAADANLCAAERAARMRYSVAILGIALVLIVAMTELGVALPYRALIALPLFASALQLMQAYSGVCIFHARAGTRTTGGVVETVMDPRQRIRVAKRAREVFVSAAMMSAVTTGIVLVVAYLG